MVKLNHHCRSTCQNVEKCFLKGLGQSDLEEIEERSILNTYKKNQTIFLQGNSSHGIFCINSGKIKILMINKDGRESIVRLVSAGDVIGHRAVFSDEPYHASAVAIEDSVVCFFDKEFIFEIIKKHHSVAIELLAKLSQTVKSAEANIADFVYKNVRERLAGLLITLKKTYGVQELNGIRLDIKLTREEMALMIGTTHETLVRLITELKDEGVIAQEGKSIFIIDEKKLIEFASL